MNNATYFVVPRCQKILPLVYDDSLSYYESICKLVDKINDLVDVINGQNDEILKNANAYTDSKIAEFNNKVSELEREFNYTVEQLEKNYSDFSKNVNNQLIAMRATIQALKEEINADIAGVNARTDWLIKQNNEYLITELSNSVKKYTVINYFTGLPTAIQDMFDYLANFHLENAITYQQFSNRDKTVDEIIALNVSFTDLAINGGTLIV